MKKVTAVALAEAVAVTVLGKLAVTLAEARTVTAETVALALKVTTAVALVQDFFFST